MPTRAAPRRRAAATFVLVHGAWAGAWSWQRVADRLAARGHRVIAPTLSGVGERSHLARFAIGLSTHVDDVVNELRWKDLEAVVLVGHSYGGLVITGVADRIPERIASLVYVEAFIPEDGQSFSDLVPGWRRGAKPVPPPPSSKGDYLREEDRAWVDGKATPQPAATFTERLRLTGAWQRIPSRTFVQATGWDGFAAIAARVRSEPGWSVHELPCGHDVPIELPDELAAILEGCAAPPGRGVPRRGGRSARARRGAAG
jgi:pimeloyl-ACP methyl ester carboxylesterase